MRKSRILATAILLSTVAAVAAAQLYYDLPDGAPLPRALPSRWLPGEGMPVEVSDFRGEIVVVPHKGSDGQQVISGLRKPRVRHLGNRQYLVGQEIATQGIGRGRDVNVTAWIPLEQTSELFEYRSVEDARKVWNLGRQAEEAVEVIEEQFRPRITRGADASPPSTSDSFDPLPPTVPDPLPKSSDAKGDFLQFSETKEVVLSAGSLKFMLDFDSGKTMDMPAMRGRPEEKQMDVHTDQMQPYHYPKELIGRGLQGVEVKASDWDASAAEVRRALAGDAVGPLKQMDLGPEKNPTYFFKTRDGALGVLQILEIVHDPKGIRIRYKRVESEPGSLPAQSPAAPSTDTLDSGAPADSAPVRKGERPPAEDSSFPAGPKAEDTGTASGQQSVQNALPLASAAEEMAMRPVSTRVNSPRNDEPECVEGITAGA